MKKTRIQNTYCYVTVGIRKVLVFEINLTSSQIKMINNNNPERLQFARFVFKAPFKENVISLLKEIKIEKQTTKGGKLYTGLSIYDVVDDVILMNNYKNIKVVFI